MITFPPDVNDYVIEIPVFYMGYFTSSFNRIGKKDPERMEVA